MSEEEEPTPSPIRSRIPPPPPLGLESEWDFFDELCLEPGSSLGVVEDCSSEALGSLADKSIGCNINLHSIASIYTV